MSNSEIDRSVKRVRLAQVERLFPNLVRLDVPTHNTANYKQIAREFRKLHDLFVVLHENDSGHGEEERRRLAYHGLRDSCRILRKLETD